MNLIMERGKMEGSVCTVHVMSSFFYPKLRDVGYSGVRRWTKKVKIYCTVITQLNWSDSCYVTSI